MSRTRTVILGFRMGSRIAVSLTMAGARVFLVELLGAVRTFEFMTLARNARERDGRDQEWEKFHRRAS